MGHPSDFLILLCNDDGYQRESIQILFRRLRSLGRTVIVAPDRERSASSLALTLRQPLRLHRIKTDIWTVDGTPADCLYFAFSEVLPRRPDLVISGMNPGPNLGRLDAHYSGTVAAAFQGTFFGVPSMAVSLVPDTAGRFHLSPAAEIVRRIAQRILTGGFPEGTTLNINIPAPPVRGIRLTVLGEKFYDRDVVKKHDPRGQAYYWIGTGHPTTAGKPGTDIRAVEKGYVSVSPLQADLTDRTLSVRGKFGRIFRELDLG